MAGWSTSNRRDSLPRDWARIRKRVLIRDNYKCLIRGPKCTGRANQVDHIVRSGTNDESNLQSACANCHAQKSSREGMNAQKRKRELRMRGPERHPGRQ
ncbi:HNH endonuclease [Pseudonocardia sp. T1-2H]|uniref:HNH endonuclease n=1 Tax=Pseudonocardia sp. T1-2H TaxID=3128899 RepID=UPI0040539B82